jgi:hypothetical protein
MRQTAATARLIDIKGTCRRYVMAVPLRSRGGIKARESDMTASPAESFLTPLRCALCGGSMKLARRILASDPQSQFAVYQCEQCQCTVTLPAEEEAR